MERDGEADLDAVVVLVDAGELGAEQWAALAREGCAAVFVRAAADGRPGAVPSSSIGGLVVVERDSEDLMHGYSLPGRMMR